MAGWDNDGDKDLEKVRFHLLRTQHRVFRTHPLQRARCVCQMVPVVLTSHLSGDPPDSSALESMVLPVVQ